MLAEVNLTFRFWGPISLVCSLGECVQVSVVGSPTHPCGIHEGVRAALPPRGPTPGRDQASFWGGVYRQRVTGSLE